MKEAIEKAWAVFFGKGWAYGKTPTKRECFEAGFKAGLNCYNEEPPRSSMGIAQVRSEEVSYEGIEV